MHYKNFIVVVVLFGVFYANFINEENDDFSNNILKNNEDSIAAENKINKNKRNISSIQTTDNKKIDDNSAVKAKNILLEVPFAPQAPFAEWHDPRQQDACEEAVALMAVKWAQKEKLNKIEAKKEILAISKYQTKNFNEYRDTSAYDTMERIIKGYFKHSKVEIKTNITIDDIIKELKCGNLIIAPMNGQALNNPYFTPPGPDRHMLVIRGYDYTIKEFITNDPGTKRGEEYHYPEDVLFKAIRDYPTGYYERINSIKKVMIVVKAE